MWKTDSGRSMASEGEAAGRRVQFATLDPCLRYDHPAALGFTAMRTSFAIRTHLVILVLESAETVLMPCSNSHRQSFGDLAGLDRPLGLPPLRVDSGKGRLAFSNPQPTAFPSHAIHVSTATCYAIA